MEFMASGTGFGAIMRWNGSENATFPNDFIFHEILELIESPIGEQSVQFLSPIPFSNATQVFHDNNIACIDASDNLCANPMVFSLHKPCLSTPETFEMPLGGFCAFRLKYTPQPLDFSNMTFNSFENLFIGSGGEVVNTDINPYNLRVQVRNRGINIFGNNHIKIQFFSNSAKSSTCNTPIAVSPEIILRNINDKFHSAVNSGKRTLARKIKGIGTLVVLNSKLLGKISFSVFASTLGFKGGFDRFTAQLRAKFGEISNIGIRSLMQNLPRAYFVITGKVVGILSGFAKFLHGLDYAFRIRNFQFHSCLNPHNGYCATMDIKSNRQFLPPLKRWASLAIR